MKSAEFTSDDLSQMRGPRGTRSAPWGKAIAEAKALAEEEKSDGTGQSESPAGSPARKHFAEMTHRRALSPRGAAAL